MSPGAPDDPGPTDRSPWPAGPGSSLIGSAIGGGAREPDRTALAAILRLELEDVLQSIYAARQDLLDLPGSSDPRATRYSAERTLNGCAATVQLLLRLLRGGTDGGPPEHPFVEMMAGPFGVLGKDYEVLYFNTALRDLIGLQHRTIALSRFEERRWIDRTLMAEHLASAVAAGTVELRTTLTRSDRREVPVLVRTSRIDGHGDPLLLVSIKAIPLLPPASAP